MLSIEEKIKIKGKGALGEKRNGIEEKVAQKGQQLANWRPPLMFKSGFCA